MARLPALVSALTEVDGRERPTIDYVARVVREAGFITTTKRGTGAAAMSPRDAAHLLIGLNGSDNPEEAALAVHRFSSLVPADIHREPEDGSVFGKIDAAPTFAAALEEAVAGAPEIAVRLFFYVAEAYGEELRSSWGNLLATGAAGLDVTMHRPGAAATMTLWHMNGGSRVIEREWRFVANSELLMAGFYGAPGGDRRTSVTFGWKTLTKLAAVMLDAEEAGE